MLYHDQMNEDMGGLGMALHCTEDGNVACMVNGAGLAMSTMDTWIIFWRHLNMAKKGLPQGPKQPKDTTVGGLTFNLSSLSSKDLLSILGGSPANFLDVGIWAQLPGRFS